MFSSALAGSSVQPPATPPVPRVDEPAADDSRPEPSTPTPRGPVLSRCAQMREFRECRGGDALKSKSYSYRTFDQYRYRSEDNIDYRPACEGWVREVMRRIDQGGRAAPPSLYAVVQQIREDATRRADGTAAQMFGRVGAYQRRASSLALGNFQLRLTERITPGSERDATINSALNHLGSELRERELAFVRLALYRAPAAGAPVSTQRPREINGHALLVQRRDRGEYAIFDPNNGAFLYQNQRSMREALAAYMNTAFRDPGNAFEAEPQSIEFYSQSALPQGGILLPHMTSGPSLPASALSREEPRLRRLLASTAQESNELSGAALAAAAGDARAVETASQGVAYLALRNVAQGRAPTLIQATDDIWRGLSDETRRLRSIDEISALQQQNRQGLVADLPHRSRRPGALHINVAPRLIDDLRHRFSELRDVEDTRVPYRNDVAELRLTFGTPPAAGGTTGGAAPAARDAADAYSIVIQRHGASGDFHRDRYELHEPRSGVFRYADFNAMSEALASAINDGYADSGGVTHVDTVYFGHYDDDQAAPQGQAEQGAPWQHESLAANITLGGIEPLLGINGNPSQTPPFPSPIAPPDFGLDESPDTQRPHVDLKRSTDYARDSKPYALFRPSTVAPAELEARGGFSSEQIAMRNVNLDLHNFDTASNLKLLDSAGYLATFRRERAAVAKLPDASGYIYFVAPTPNMIDVNMSLGSYVRRPENFEVAAMGRIDYAQIRGWRAVSHGVAGAFVANPKYRWDVYNQTRTAGAQPQLSRLPVDSGVWNQSGYRAFVSRDSRGVAIGFKQDLNRMHAQFYDNAWETVRRIQARQAAALDYRGPLTIDAYGGNDTQGVRLYIDAEGVPQVAGTRTPASRHEFTMGDDGRFHLASDYSKVLRVGNDGNVYLGAQPSNPNSTNGVFNYANSQLVHLEDGKYLTVGAMAYRPFVTDASAGLRSQWALRKPDGGRATPPQINEYTFRRLTGGQHRLYLFETDPDSALPETATHFVTRVPGNRYEGNFLNYADWIPYADVRDTSRWLFENNAAWLFPDGYYLMSTAPGRLTAHTLDGVEHWRAEYDPRSGTVRFGQRMLSSSYRISEDAMDRVRQKEARRQKLSTLLN